MGLVYALGAATLLVSVAYWLAGDVWRRRHSLRYRLGGRERRCSGAVGEIALVAFGALLLFIIDRTSETTRLADIPLAHPWLSGLGLLCVAVIAYGHGITEALRAPPEDKPVLLRTYLVYGAFSTIFFFGGVMLVALLVLETGADVRAFAERREAILGILNSVSAANPSERARLLEMVLLESEELLSTMQDSLAPVFVFAAGIFAVNLAIRLTPLRTLFVDNAMLITHLSSLAGVLILVLAVAYVYVGPYTDIVERLLGGLEAARPAVFEGDPDTIRRYSDIVLRIIDQKSVVGFLSRISSEWGGLAAALGVAQWIAEQFAKPEAADALERVEPTRPIPGL